MQDIAENNLYNLSKVDFKDVDIATLTDIRDIEIDVSKSPKERFNSLMEQTNNPYIFKHDNVVVKISFKKDTDKCIEDKVNESFVFQ